MNQSTVIIEHYEVDASIGVFEWEKKIPQRLIFDLELSGDFSAASVTDILEDAIDYAAVCKAINTVVSSRHFNLLESLAENVVDKLFSLFPVQNLTLTINKPGAVPRAESVGVKIIRFRKDE